MSERLTSTPLLLEPVLCERPWGNRRLADYLGKTLPPSARIGESWETANEARIASGPLTGQTLRDVVSAFSYQLLGRLGVAASSPFGDFPLLVKFLDADDVLSLQVHPDDAQAAPLGQRGKTEVWHILAATPQANLVVGLTEPLDQETLRQVLAQQQLPAYLVHLTVQPGDTILVPAGTLHAIGSGILLYELQEQSDITYRFYDWDRRDAEGRQRPLHVEEGLAVLKPASRGRRIMPLQLDHGRQVLAACRHFLLERWDIDGSLEVPLRSGETFRIVSCIGGSLQLASETGPWLSLALGQSALLPALASALRLAGHGTVLVASVPDLWHDVIMPLRQVGYSNDLIAQLAGDTEDLAHLPADNPSQT